MDNHHAATGSGPTRILADLAATVQIDQIDTSTRHIVARHLIDTVGVAIAGTREPLIRRLLELNKSVGTTGCYAVSGLRERFDPLTAIHLMATSAHLQAFDDGFTIGSAHIGSVVVPVSLVTGAMADVDGKTLISSIVAGYEVMARIAAAHYPAVKDRGFHSSPLAGVFGGAATAGRICGLDGKRIEHAFGLAASAAGGLFAFIHGGGGDVRPLHAGHAARDGAMAGLMASHGVDGPLGVFEVQDGYFSAFTGNAANAAKITRRPDRQWSVTRCYMKPFAICRHVQPALDALLKLKERFQLRPDDVAHIRVKTYAVAAYHVDGGWTNPEDARLSFPYIMASGLLRGGAPESSFVPTALTDDRIAEIATRLSIEIDEDCDRRYPQERPAHVILDLTDGRQVDLAVRDGSGSHDDPMSDREIEEKFLDLVVPSLGERPARDVLTSLWDIENLNSAKALLSNLARS